MPRMIAMCTHPDGPHEHVPITDREQAKTCFADCGCEPQVYVIDMGREHTTTEPFDPADLVRWAEDYGHPEEWAKRAQAAHNRAEGLAEEIDRLRVDLQWLLQFARGNELVLDRITKALDRSLHA